MGILSYGAPQVLLRELVGNVVGPSTRIPVVDSMFMWKCPCVLRMFQDLKGMDGCGVCRG